jgi:hypothetical protein
MKMPNDSSELGLSRSTYSKLASMDHWPERLFDLISFHEMNDKLTDLSDLAEDENWDYVNTASNHHLPILYNYLQYTYQRLAEEAKIEISDDGQHLTFNTGLVTANQEPIFAYCDSNTNPHRPQNWFFKGWKRKGEYQMTRFSVLPSIAHYFDDAGLLVMDYRLELRANIEHIVSENKDRFPEPYRTMPDYSVQTVVKGAIDNSIERVRRNYKTAIPQFHNRRIQLLLPLCLHRANVADIAIVVQKHDSFYRASTCLTLDMAYNNARLLARPDRDWLLP